MNIVGVFGRKGGSGKTMVSQLLAHGLSKGFGIWTNVVMTDVREDQPVSLSKSRKYYISTLSNVDPKQDLREFAEIVHQAKKVENSVLIIDGGANRVNLDIAFSKFCNLVIIPVGISAEDISVAEADFMNLYRELKAQHLKTQLYILRNRWPNDKQRKEALLKRQWVSDFLAKGEMGRYLFPDYVPDMASFVDMANPIYPKTTPLVDSIAVDFAELVAKKLKIDLPPRLKLVAYGEEEESKVA